MNQILADRLESIRQQLVHHHAGGAGMSSATKGNEREVFLGEFLKRVLPPPYRFGTGDATDIHGMRSGQLDIVVEYPLLPSLPMPTTENRLYLVEGVAAVIEVKSDVAAQWDEVERTTKALHGLRRDAGQVIARWSSPNDSIPVYAVGYRGWSDPATIQRKLIACDVAGVLVIEHGIFVGQRQWGVKVATGGASLWALICSLNHLLQGIELTSLKPLSYLEDDFRH